MNVMELRYLVVDIEICQSLKKKNYQMTIIFTIWPSHWLLFYRTSTLSLLNQYHSVG